MSLQQTIFSKRGKLGTFPSDRTNGHSNGIPLEGQRLILVHRSGKQAHMRVFCTLACSQPVPICQRLKINNEDCEQTAWFILSTTTCSHAGWHMVSEHAHPPLLLSLTSPAESFLIWWCLTAGTEDSWLFWFYMYLFISFSCFFFPLVPHQHDPLGLVFRAEAINTGFK